MEILDPSLTHSGAVEPETGVPAKSTAGSPGHFLARPANRLLLALLVLGLLVIAQANALLDAPQPVTDRFQTFVTIFLSIFIEAVSFLLAGSIVSGFIAVFVGQEMLARFIPRQPILGALAGASLGMVFPVCECGVVPVTRRLYQKGLPQSVGIAFLLAAPVVNPIVVASTYAAFGWGPLLYGRLGFSFLIAAVIGLIFYLAKPQETILPESTYQPDHAHGPHCQHEPEIEADSPGQRVWLAMRTAGDDFLDMARYLIVGSILAAGMQTLIPQATLLTLGQGALISTLAMMAFAFILSVCSTVDAFLALAFVNTFPPASILAFLVFGPMVDIKSALMFLGVFRRRAVAYLILLPLMMTLLIAIYLNLNVRL